MPKVSVVMSIYKPNERYLAEQLKTIDDQDYDDFEIVVYNDCPTDDSWEAFCHSQVSRHKLRYVAGTENLGYIKAFEHLVGLAEGSYIALCDQDDRWLPGRIARGVQMLDEGYLLVRCDRQIIDGEGNVQVESWREAHPSEECSNWHSGDHITGKAAFTCYSIGMATMVRADVARRLSPFPACVGHDKWLALGASELGRCASIDEPLVQYRRHGGNETGTLQGISCKEDWYQTRVKDSYELAHDFARRFPDSSDAADICAFADARMNKDLLGIWRHRNLAPQVASFEIALRLTPEPLFKAMLSLYRRRSA